MPCQPSLTPPSNATTCISWQGLSLDTVVCSSVQGRLEIQKNSPPHSPEAALKKWWELMYEYLSCLAFGWNSPGRTPYAQSPRHPRQDWALIPKVVACLLISPWMTAFPFLFWFSIFTASDSWVSPVHHLHWILISAFASGRGGAQANIVPERANMFVPFSYRIWSEGQSK